MLIGGVGCRRNCPADDILDLIRRAEMRVQALAAPAFKASEPGLREAAAQLGLPLILIEQPDLEAAQPRCRTYSRMGAVAEGCALAACGDESRLVLARIANTRATYAVASDAAI